MAQTSIPDWRTVLLVVSTSTGLVVVTVLLFPGTFLGFPVPPSRNATAGTVGSAWSLLAEDEHSPREPRERRTPAQVVLSDPPTDAPTTEEPVESTTPHYVKDYEVDYPQIFEVINISTTRVPKKFKRLPFRSLVDAKCERRDEGIMFADPTWCSRYFHCRNGFLNVYVCPEVTVFNPQIQGCVHRRSYPCSASILNLSIANWRRVMTGFYMTTDRAWVRARMMKKVKPMKDVTFPTDPPYIPVDRNNETTPTPKNVLW